MKSDFLIAITQLSAEKNLPKEVVIAAVETALVSAYRKDNFASNQNISVKINPTNGKVQVWAEKLVVERPSDSRSELSLAEARLIKPDVLVGEALTVEATPSNAGRIAAQTAKQVILQRLHEAEHSAIFEEYATKKGDIIAGIIQRIESRQVLVDLGRTEAILPAGEQVPAERYRVGQRLKVIVLDVVPTPRGPRVVVSRSHPDLLRRLFEMEVPEIFNGAVALKSIAREAGSRSKVAVVALQEGVDPVGCCVGLRGIRIQNIANELNGEKIDVVKWSAETTVFIANALSPAQILSVALDGQEEVATVVVPDRQLSLAIGKEGQNVRLAAKLTGWRIDIKSASAVEAARAEAAKSLAEAEMAEAVETALGMEAEKEAIVVGEVPTEMPPVPEPVLTSAVASEPLPPLESAFISPPIPFEPQVMAEKPRLRFAEDILAPRSPVSQAKPKKKKKGVRGREGEEEGSKGRKLRRGIELTTDDEEF